MRTHNVSSSSLLAILRVCLFAALVAGMVFFALPSPAAFAQSPDDGFNIIPSNWVSSIVVQPDGKIIVGGGFSMIGGQAHSHIARLNPDGSLDTTFNPGTDANIYVIVLQADGKIVVGGAFTTMCGQPRNNIGRLNPNGSLDTTFNPGANEYVRTLAIQADGKILVGGYFTELDGWRRNYIGRLNRNGSVDTSFNPGASYTVDALKVQDDGKILVGGGFTTLGGQSRSYLGRLNPDGSLDDAFNPGPDYFIDTFAIQADGKIVIGGGFSTVGGQSRRNIARLNPDGSLDTAFNPIANSYVYDMVAQTDGKIVFGGLFTTVGGQTRNHIARVNPNGSLDTTFNPGANNYVRGVAIQADSKILVGGGFTTLGGQTHNYLGRLYANGSLETTMNPGANSTISAIAVQADSKIVVGGEFTTLGGQTRQHIGRLNPNGSLDTTFNPVANGWVSALALQVDGKILVGGEFTTLNGQACERIGRLNPNGSLDTTFNSAANGWVTSLAVQADGKILVGGDFTVLGGETRERIARLNPDGSLDSTFNAGADGWVSSLAVQADGMILVAGGFFTLNGQVRENIGRLNPDGSLDDTFNPGANNWIETVVVQADGKIVVGGGFTELGGQTRERIGRLNPDGSLDTTFTPGANNWVSTLAQQTDGKIIVGGNFTTLNEQTREHIGRLNPDGSLDANFNPGANNWVEALAVQVDGKVLIGGGFTVLGGQPRSYIGRLSSITAAFQNLAVDRGGTAITWTRSGSGPEVWRVTFEQSTDGVIYSLLGEGERIPGGWQLNELTLPKGLLWLRARGYYSTGYYNGSLSMVELVQNVFLVNLPIADAGLDQSVNTSNMVILDGSASYDPEGDLPLTYLWTQTTGPAVTLSDPTGITSTFTAPSDPVTLTFELVVTNNLDLISMPDEVVVTVNNQPPVSRAGLDQVVNRLSLVTLDGSSSHDPDGDLPLTYLWVQTNGPTVNLNNLTAINPTFTAPNVPVTLTFSLIVTDSLGLPSTLDEVVVTVNNQPPVANAGLDQVVNRLSLVTLDGSSSHDPDGDLLTYRWVQTNGPMVNLSDPIAINPTFTAPNVPVTLTFSLIVTDSLELPSTPDEVVVVVNNQLPVADAGANQAVDRLGLVTLNGSSSYDPDGDLPLTYRWVQTNGPMVNLSDPTAISITFAAPNVPATLIFSLIVTDSLGLPSTPDEVVVAVDNQPPVADAGPDQSVNTNDLVILDGGASSDPDGDLPLTYQWVQTGGPTVTLSDPTDITTTFTVPSDPAILTFILVTTDSLSLPSAPDEVVVVVNNQPPVADAGLDQAVNRLNLVTLDGSSSHDPDGDLPLTYRWVQTNGPIVNLSNPTTISPTFTTPNIPATLTFSLIVTDSLGLPSASDEVVVTVNNQPPVADAGPDQSVYTNDLVMLDGSASSDPDGDLSLTYQWVQTGGLDVSLSDPTAIGPSFVAPNTPVTLTFSLVVTDSLGMSALMIDEIVITIQPYHLYLPLVVRDNRMVLKNLPATALGSYISQGSFLNASFISKTPLSSLSSRGRSKMRTKRYQNDTICLTG